MENNSNDITFTSAVFWRRSLILGYRTIPAILRFKDGVLSLESQEGKAFTVPIGEVKARFSIWGTLLVTVGETTYAFRTMRETWSPLFNEQQIAELKGTNEQMLAILPKIGINQSQVDLMKAKMLAPQLDGKQPILAHLYVWKMLFQKFGVLNPNSASLAQRLGALALIVVVLIVGIVFFINYYVR